MFRARLGVRTRVLAIALVPSAALLVIGVGGAGYLVAQGNHAREWGAALQDATPTTRELVNAVQAERQVTLAQLAGEEPNPKALSEARLRMDAAIILLEPITAKMEALGPQGVTGDVGGFQTLTRQLAAVRTQVDAGVLPFADAYTFYGHLLDLVSVGTSVVMITAPSSEVAVETGETLTLISASEMLTRSAGLAEVLLHDGTLPPELGIEYARLTGGYRISVEALARDEDDAETINAATLINGQNWQRLIMMENSLMARALDPVTNPDPKPVPLAFTEAEWRDTVSKVNQALLTLWDVQNLHAQGLSEQAGEEYARNSLIAGGGMFLVAVSAFGVALVLANRIIRRLKRLRDQTLALADDRLPQIMTQLRDGKDVDVAAETPPLDFGSDEIGQVAKAFSHAHEAAVEAAVTEARTREGVKAVFLNIAHRSQVVVHRQLEVLDDAESKQEDPSLLEIFFRLDHLATRERRNAENLIILAGGQPGRQWRNPVALVEVVRSGVGEALDYTRVKITRLPEIAVAGSAVADLVHLVAELVDNAAHFSPPTSQVEVRGNVVGKGIAVEIVDQGMGMPESELERVNEMLRNPPDFGVNTLSEDSRLGMFVVAQLAVRNGISVRLTESDYGGVRAIVLIPSSLTVAAPGTGEIPAVPKQLEAVAAQPQAESFHAAESFPTAEPFPTGEPFRTSESFHTGEMRQLDAPPALPARPGPTAPERPLTPLYSPAPAFDAFASPARSFEESAKPYEPPTEPNPPHRPSIPAPQPEIGFRPRESRRAQYTGSDVRPALPRRRRQASLAPELAQDTTSPETSSQPTRTAEQARDLMSAIENGTRQGRRADPGASEPVSNPFPDRQEGDGDHLKRW
ncbi:sensor histidine kinase [Nocardia crassostreae]|uniref:sensor histidine kinase n=1 Tax=Nocardia crassostreae TaxID=53428 RepID=UPI0008298C2A|nr:nitrate- and nitrite sensing domain-containing protein [Nocardia crassostreae]